MSINWHKPIEIVDSDGDVRRARSLGGIVCKGEPFFAIAVTTTCGDEWLFVANKDGAVDGTDFTVRNAMNLCDVEMRPAFQWTCPDCGIDHFASAVVLEMLPQERMELFEERGIPLEASGYLMKRPDAVTCPECNRQFVAVEYQDEVEEDEL